MVIATRSRPPGITYRSMTLTGNEIMDNASISRRTGAEGDGAPARGHSGTGVWEGTTNLIANGGFETNVTGWTTGGTNTIAVSTAQQKFGAQSCLATYSNNAVLADFAITITNAGHVVSCWVYIPTAYDGDGVELRQLNYTVAASAVAANMSIRDAWQRLTLTFTPGADVIGNIQINNTGTAPTATRFLYIDGVQVELQPIATPYVETDGGTASRTDADILLPVVGLIEETQSWVIVRIVPGWTASAGEPGGGSNAIGLWSWIEGGDERINVLYIEGSNVFEFGRFTLGSGPITSQGVTVVKGVPITVVGAWDATGVYGSVNGAAFSFASGTQTPALTEPNMTIGSARVVWQQFDGDVLWFACGLGTLTNGMLTHINSMGNNSSLDELMRSFPSARVTLFWDGVTGRYEVPS